jgi:hypothetical protein
MHIYQSLVFVKCLTYCVYLFHILINHDPWNAYNLLPVGSSEATVTRKLILHSGKYDDTSYPHLLIF